MRVKIDYDRVSSMDERLGDEMVSLGDLLDCYTDSVTGGRVWVDFLVVNGDCDVLPIVGSSGTCVPHASTAGVWDSPDNYAFPDGWTYDEGGLFWDGVPHGVIGFLEHNLPEVDKLYRQALLLSSVDWALTVD